MQNYSPQSENVKVIDCTRSVLEEMGVAWRGCLTRVLGDSEGGFSSTDISDDGWGHEQEQSSMLESPKWWQSCWSSAQLCLLAAESLGD